MSEPYQLVLKNLKDYRQFIVLDEYSSMKAAEEGRKLWRKALGDKKWTVNRRVNLDTLDHLALTIVRVE